MGVLRVDSSDDKLTTTTSSTLASMNVELVWRNEAWGKPVLQNGATELRQLVDHTDIESSRSCARTWPLGRARELADDAL